MDEATSHLDEENEKKTNQAIAQLAITRVIVAHRKSTIDSADRCVNL
ncbi:MULTISPECIES: secretion ATPase [Rodentibacter]|nr:secretion ATPase [Rodentibacter sp. JRC1]